MLNRKQLVLLVLVVLVGAFVLWLGRDDAPESTKLLNPDSLNQSPPAVAAPSSPAESDVHQIVLPHDDPEFPPAPGRDVFISRCTVCHSLRYITMQPNFPKKVWAKEVAKMINTYGAHVSGEEARQITEYLATIKSPDSPQVGAPK